MAERRRRLASTSLATLTWMAWLVCGPAAAQAPQRPEVGHWIEVKGTLQGGQFFADAVEVIDPEDEESIIGTVERVAPDGTWFTVLGQRVTVSERTKWRKISLEKLEGARVKVEGHYRGPRKFSSRTISPRKPGRDRITGRLDSKRRIDYVTELRVMNFAIILVPEIEIEHERPLSDYAITEGQRTMAQTGQPVRRRDDDKDIPVTVMITDDLRLGLRLDYQGRREDNYNLNENDAEDRTDHRFAVRGELIWLPSDRFYTLFGFQYQKLLREDEEDGRFEPEDWRLREAFGYVRDVGLSGLDFQVGRQDFDEDREWIYDELLDAVRTHYRRGDWSLELSASTILADGSPRNEASDNLIAYLSRTDDDTHLAAWAVDRRSTLRDEFPIHFGVRALGEWLPDNEIWAEASVLRGYNDTTTLRGWAFDVGTTYAPDFLGPFYINAGYALGSGDSNPNDDNDDRFRQTGFQDNTDKLGGVTSYKYYGELMDPELSNLGVLTLGIGARIGKRNSLDLVYHEYRQDVPEAFLFNTDLDRRPTGLDPDLGWELDLVFGSRAWRKMDVELVLAMFEPGAAFTRRDTAYFAKVQLRFKP